LERIGERRYPTSIQHSEEDIPSSCRSEEPRHLALRG